MKILHVSTTDRGGAANSTIRLHKALVNEGISSALLTTYKSRSDIPYHFDYQGRRFFNKPEIPALTLKNYFKEKLTHDYGKALLSYNLKIQQRNELSTPKFENGIYSFEKFSFADSNFDITSTQPYQEADVIHLHWVADFLDYGSFFETNKKPVIWTLHDENPFMGAFHYEADERRNHEQYKSIDDAIRKIKTESVRKQKKLYVCSPSDWLRERASKSEIFKSREFFRIRYGLDTRAYRLYDRAFSRNLLGLPQDKFICLFVSESLTNYRKGLDRLSPLFGSNEFADVYFALAGKSKNAFTETNISHLGNISDERLMAAAYCAADVYLLTSREDNLPNTMIESICCGTPVIAFAIGDNEAVIAETNSGMIVPEPSTDSLKITLRNFINEKERFNRDDIFKQATKSFENARQAKEYIELYTKILKE